MKRFSFPLESALCILKTQADVEHAKLARVESERAGCRWELNLLPMNLRNAADREKRMPGRPFQLRIRRYFTRAPAIGGAL